MSFFIDTDNGLGSQRGDVDDGFALTALLLSHHSSVIGIGAVDGNTPAVQAHLNNQQLARLLDYSGPVLAATDAVAALSKTDTQSTLMALGPLTNIAAAFPKSGDGGGRNLVVVGGNYASKGRWPPVYPYEFNLVKDKAATCSVLRNDFNLTFVPLDVARRFRFTFEEVAALPGNIGAYLTHHSRRWWRRCYRLKLARSAPIWDLLAVMVAIDPGNIKQIRTAYTCHDNTWIEWGKGSRPCRVVVDFDRPALWRRFSELIESAEATKQQALSL